MKKLTYKKYFTLCLLICFQVEASFTIDREESITLSTFNTLRKISTELPEVTEAREMDLKSFNTTFPEVKSSKIYNFCGKLQMEFSSFLFPIMFNKYVYNGSASLIEYDAETEYFIGITAKHNFFDSRAWIYKKATKAVFFIGENNGSNLGEIDIKYVLPHHDAKIDVALFYGSYRGLNKNNLIKNLPKIPSVETGIDIEKSYSIIHYPDGNGNQRINSGILTNLRSHYGYYEIDTVPGSSGAPLVDLDTHDIIGVHIRGHERRDLAVIFNDGHKKRILKVSPENECVLINNEFYDNLKLNERVYLG